MLKKLQNSKQFDQKLVFSKKLRNNSWNIKILNGRKSTENWFEFKQLTLTEVRKISHKK